MKRPSVAGLACWWPVPNPAWGDAELPAELFGELVFVAVSDLGGDGFHREVAAQNEVARLVQADLPQLLHWRASGQPFEFSHEGEPAHARMAGDVGERELVGEAGSHVVADLCPHVYHTRFRQRKLLAIDRRKQFCQFTT